MISKVDLSRSENFEEFIYKFGFKFIESRELFNSCMQIKYEVDNYMINIEQKNREIKNVMIWCKSPLHSIFSTSGYNDNDLMGYTISKDTSRTLISISFKDFLLSECRHMLRDNLINSIFL